MSKVTINIEDDGQGMAVSVNFEGGFNPNSHAHQHANLMIGAMDEMAQRRDEADGAANTTPKLELVKG